MDQRFYSDDEASEILRVASEAAPAGQMSRAELLRAAQEMGLDPAKIEQAEAMIVERKQMAADRILYEKSVKQKAFGDLKSYTGTVVTLLLINFFTSGFTFHNMWSLWLIGFMLLWPLSAAAEALVVRPWKDDEKFRRWREQRKRAELAKSAPVSADVSAVGYDSFLDAHFAAHPEDSEGAEDAIRTVYGLGDEQAKATVAVYLRQHS